MTRAEFYEKYGDVKVTFASYYKFTFTYEGALPDGQRLTCTYGGNSDQIYRHEACPGTFETVLNLQPYSGTVFAANGESIEGFYDY